MTNASRQSIAGSGIKGATSVAVIAAVLILLGIVFQLGELGFGDLRPENSWLFSVLIAGFWNMLALRFNVGVHDVIQYWPLALVCVGVALLLVGRRSANGHKPNGASTGGRHGG
jgi:hypothetical protein